MDLLNIDHSLVIYTVTGFFAQLIASSLGMGYGTSSSAILLSIGVPPFVMSASVHTARLFTSLVGAISHHRLGNVDIDVLKRLILPGVVGGVIGALLLTQLSGDFVTPLISIYLMIMGIRILLKSLKKNLPHNLLTTSKITTLATFGGFFDAICGGGWGPIVTSTLLSNGHQPRHAIGTVIISEFFVTAAEVAVFLVFIHLMDWQVIIGLIVGGMISAPIGAMLCKYIPANRLMFLVGTFVCLLSIKTIAFTII